MQSPARSPERGRRYLIAAGTSSYPSLSDDEQLPSVTEDLRIIDELFTRELGYARVMPELGEDPPAETLRKKLSAWFSHSDRRSDDLVVLYYSGHGEIVDRHYLLTSDFDGSNYVGKAFPTEDFAHILAASAVRKLFLMIDTCWSGGAVEDMMAIWGNVELARRARRPRGEELAEVILLVASRRKEAAAEAVFASAFAEAVHAPRSAGVGPEHVDLFAIVGMINEDFARRSLDQHARLMVAPQESALPPFLPNPSFRAGLPSTIDVETERRLLKQPDLITHWGPRSRGVDIEAEPGWLFCGRHAAMRELVRVAAGKTRPGTCVVTGDPGSGKSAVLARLVTLADPVYRRRAELGDAPRDTIPPVGAVDIAIHARGKTLAEIAAELAVAAECEDAESAVLVNALAADARRRLVIVVDAVDEASEPEALARGLLRPLAHAVNVRLLVGTRRPLLKTLGPNLVEIDLDKPPYRDRDAVAQYVERILADGAGARPSEQPSAWARDIATEVATRAEHSFLIAGLVARTLAGRDTETVDLLSGDWSRRLASVGDALDAYLARLGRDEERARALLRPLAYAEGAGLPWDSIWAPLASALSGRSYADADVEWLLDVAGAYVLRTTDRHGREVYRLFHQALADHLRPLTREEHNQRQLAGGLRSTVPSAGNSVLWQAAHPYLRGHLATHAAAGGALDELLLDPGFLIVAAPASLKSVLSRAESDDARTATRAYGRAAHRLAAADGTGLASLRLAALQTGADSLAGRLTRAPTMRRITSWWPAWSWWRDSLPSTVIGRIDGGATSLVVAQDGDRPLAVIGTANGVEVWALEDDERTAVVPTDTVVSSLAVTMVAGAPAVAAGLRGGAIRFYTLPELEPLHVLRDAHQEAVLALCSLHETEHQLLASGGNDAHLRLWDLKTGSAVNAVRAHPAVRAIVVCALGDGNVIVTGGDTAERGSYPEGEDTIRAWSPPDLSLISRVRPGSGLVSALHASRGPQGPIVIADTSRGIELLRVRVPEGERITGPLRAPMNAVLELGARPGDDLLFQASDGLLRSGAVRIEHGREVLTLDGAIEGPGGRVAGPVAVHGRHSIISASDTVRLWDTRDLPAWRSNDTGERLDDLVNRQQSHGIAALAGSASAIVAVTEDGAVRRFLPADGEPRHVTTLPERCAHAALADHAGDHPLLVCTGSKQSYTVDLDSATTVEYVVVRHGEITDVACTELDGHAVVAVAAAEPRSDGDVDRFILVQTLSRDGKRWRPDVSAERRLPAGQHAPHRSLWVALAALAGRPIIVGACRPDVTIWDADTREEVERFHFGWENVVGVAAVAADEDALVAALSWDGRLGIWQLGDHSSRAQIPDGSGLTGTLTWVRWRDVPSVATGDIHGAVRLWSPTGELRALLEVDAPVTSLAAAGDNLLVVGTTRGLVVASAD